MSSDDLVIAFICLLIGIIIGLFIIIKCDKNKQIECYQDYMKLNIIPTRCEKYFKDLKIGSDKE